MGLFDRSQELLSDIDNLLSTGVGIYQKATGVEGKADQKTAQPSPAILPQSFLPGVVPLILGGAGVPAYSVYGAVTQQPETVEPEVPWGLIAAGAAILAIVFLT